LTYTEGDDDDDDLGLMVRMVARRSVGQAEGMVDGWWKVVMVGG